MNDLTLTEQKHARIALLVLWRKLGGFKALGKALSYQPRTLNRAANARREISSAMAFRIARLAGVPLDDLLAGRNTPNDVCPHCGRMKDFSDEDTIVVTPESPTTQGGQP